MHLLARSLSGETLFKNGLIYRSYTATASSGWVLPPYDEDPYVVPCFSCRIEDNIGNGGEPLTNEEVEEALLDWHAEGCLWGDMRRDAAASS